MKITINKDSILAAAQKTLSIAEKNSSIPVLSNILFRAEEGNRLVITATDKEITSVSSYCAEVTKPGIALMPAKKFSELLRECQSEEITIEAAGNISTVKSGKSKFKLPIMSPDDYPNVGIPDGEDIQYLTMSGNDLKELLSKVAYATANDNGTMKNMAGVFMEALPSDNKLVMVATNGHRMSLINADIPGAASAIPSGVIIPDKAVAEIKKFADGAERVLVGMYKGDVIVKKDDAYLKLSTIDMSYPDYKRAIPNNSDIFLTANRKDFMQAVRRVKIVSDGASLDLSMSVSTGKISFKAFSEQYGEASDFIDTDYEGDEVVTNFNAGYLLEAISAMDAETVSLKVNEGLRPTIVTPKDGNGQLALVMPLKS